MILYTAGYRSWSYYDFKSELRQLDNPLVVDVRFNPHTVLPFWNKEHLQKDLKDGYKHLVELGNRNYANGGEIKIVDFDKGYNFIYDMAQSNINCLLLCACEDLSTCHRGVLSDEISMRLDCPVIHI